MSRSSVGSSQSDETEHHRSAEKEKYQMRFFHDRHATPQSFVVETALCRGRVGLFNAPPEGQGGGRLSPRESTTSSVNVRKNSRKENSPSIVIIHSRKEEDRAQLELLKISRRAG
jgi:hypothetical protein